jgi:V/A-type H+-transporting ATPase subunit E
MTGLDSIIKSILDEAAAEAEDMRSKAHTEADAILEKANAEALATEKNLAAGAKAQASEVNGARDSAISLLRRQRTLETKQNVLRETLEKAQAEILALPPEEYFSLCLGLALRAAEEGEGELFWSEADIKNQPADFEKRLAAGLPSGKTLRVAAASSGKHSGRGFVLRYGNVEQNCAFGALFSAREEEFSDLIRPILFPA